MESENVKIVIGAFAILGGLWLIIKMLPMLIVMSVSLISWAIMLLVVISVGYGIFYLLKKL